MQNDAILDLNAIIEEFEKPIVTKPFKRKRDDRGDFNESIGMAKKKPKIIEESEEAQYRIVNESEIASSASAALYDQPVFGEDSSYMAINLDPIMKDLCKLKKKGKEILKEFRELKKRLNMIEKEIRLDQKITTLTKLISKMERSAQAKQPFVQSFIAKKRNVWSSNGTFLEEPNEGCGMVIDSAVSSKSTLKRANGVVLKDKKNHKTKSISFFKNS